MINENSTIFPMSFDELEEDSKRKFTQCIKKPIKVRCMKVDVPFRVKSIEGDHAQGKPGDYLMCGVEGELYVIDKEIFLKTYNFVDE